MKLGTNAYYTTLDLASEFHQLKINPAESIQKTVFCTNNGHFEFKAMPFVLKNATAIFQRLTSYVLREWINKICLEYLTDIIILPTSLSKALNYKKIIRNTKTSYSKDINRQIGVYVQRGSLPGSYNF